MSRASVGVIEVPVECLWEREEFVEDRQGAGGRVMDVVCFCLHAQFSPIYPYHTPLQAFYSVFIVTKSR